MNGVAAAGAATQRVPVRGVDRARDRRRPGRRTSVAVGRGFAAQSGVVGHRCGSVMRASVRRRAGPCGPRQPGAPTRYPKLSCIALPRGAAAMKQITAIVKPFKLEEVREALAEVGITG